MPNIGDIAKGQDIGKNKGTTYQWCACVECGLERWVRFSLTQPLSQRCKKCYMKAPSFKINQSKAMLGKFLGNCNPNWKGGRVKNMQGYIRVKLTPDDFFFPMADKRHYVMEHRLVMAQHLGRNLHLWETVHHKGVRYKGIENKSDNLIDNLQLVTDDRHNQITRLETRIGWLEQENKALRDKLKCS